MMIIYHTYTFISIHYIMYRCVSVCAFMSVFISVHILFTEQSLGQTHQSSVEGVQCPAPAGWCSGARGIGSEAVVADCGGIWWQGSGGSG